MAPVRMLPPLPRRDRLLEPDEHLAVEQETRRRAAIEYHRARLIVELGDRCLDDAVEHVGGIGALVDVAGAAPGEKALEGLIQDLTDPLVIGLEDLADLLLDRQRHVGTGLRSESFRVPYQKTPNSKNYFQIRCIISTSYCFYLSLLHNN